MVRLIQVKVHPGSRQSRLELKREDRFEIWVRADAERGSANAEAIHLLSLRLNLPAKRLKIIKGASAPNKIIALLGDS